MIVGEWMGCYGVDENLLSPLLVARDRWLKPAARCCRKGFRRGSHRWRTRSLPRETAFWRERPYGVDFSPVAEAICQRGADGPASSHRRDATGGGAALVEHGHSQHLGGRGQPALRGRLCSSSLQGPGRLSALAAWFEAVFPGWQHAHERAGGAVDTLGAVGFAAERKPRGESRDARRGRADLRTRGPRLLPPGWSVRVGQGEWEHHDTRRDVT